MARPELWIAQGQQPTREVRFRPAYPPITHQSVRMVMTSRDIQTVPCPDCEEGKVVVVSLEDGSGTLACESCSFRGKRDKEGRVIIIQHQWLLSGEQYEREVIW